MMLNYTSCHCSIDLKKGENVFLLNNSIVTTKSKDFYGKEHI